MKTIERRSIVWSLLTISGCLAPASKAVLAALPMANVEANAPQEIAIAAAIAAIPLVSNAAITGKAAIKMLFIYFPPKLIISFINLKLRQLQISFFSSHALRDVRYIRLPSQRFRRYKTS